MNDQGALTLMRSCRECGADIPWDGGPGRPRVLCDACRPSEWAPIRGRRINQSVSVSPIPRHRVTDPETSVAAAESVAASAEKLTERILATYDEMGWLNPFECASQLPDQLEATVRAAVGRLRRAGVLVATGRTRPSTTGSPSQVLRRA